jgi:uncharacterized membrane protein HdeD (DUF308 family)
MTTPLDRLRRVRRWLMITSSVMIALGSAAVIVPAVASIAIAMFVGWILAFAGVLMIAHVIRSHRRSAARVVTGALTLTVGVCILAFPLTGTLTLTFFLVGWFLANGTVLLIEAYRERGMPEARLEAIEGVLSLLLGALIAASLPSSADWAIGLLVGVNLMIFGVRAFFAARMIDRLTEAAEAAVAPPAFYRSQTSAPWTTASRP